MPVCRACGKGWPDDYAVCPDDGTRLGPPSAMTVGSLAPALSPRGRYDEDLAPGSVAGEYRIEKKIGEGGMGAVYGAKHPVIGKRAAIKVIKRELSSNPEAVDRFVREAQAVNTIGHPNIVDVFSFGALPDGRSFFVMEWLQGESLRARLERPLTYSEAIDIIDTIAKALNAAHDAGVVHRDLKPDNVFLATVRDEKPTVMLLDFGLAKLSGNAQGQEEGRIERTRTGVVMGTPLYISPEQAKGTKVEASTDVYALGVMAYEMFTGRVPFLADSAVEIMSLHITQQPVPPTQIAPNLPPQVDALVLRMMQKDPHQRPLLPQVRKQILELRGLAASVSPVGSGEAPGAWPVATPLPTTPQMAPTGMESQPSQIVPATSARQASPVPSQRGQPAADAPVSRSPVRRKRPIALILAVVVAVAGVGAAVVAVMSRGKTDKVVAKEPPKATEPAKVAVKVTPPTVAVTEPAKVAVTEPAKVAVKVTPPTVAVTQPAKVAVPPAKIGKPEPLKIDTPAPTKPGEPRAPDQVSATKPGKLGQVIVVLEGAAKGAVFVDGKLVGRGLVRATIALAPGEHTIRAESPKHKTAETTVHIDPGAQTTVKLVLKKQGAGVNGALDPFGGD